MAIVWFLLSQLFLVVLCTGEVVNVALQKPTSMSSRFDTRPPSIAVDGNTTAADPYGIIHTDTKQTSAWWWVYLQTKVQDPTVEIYFRTDYLYRRNGVKVYTTTELITSYPQGQLCHTVTGSLDGTDIPDVVTVNCSTCLYLMVYTEANNDGEGAILDFGEVQILGCDGTYGDTCDKSCNSRQCAVTSTCDRYTGACPDGCMPGYRKIDCTEGCASGTYGANCAKSCSIRQCRIASSCDRTSGQCSNGCKDEWTGVDCTSTCTEGSYGLNCTSCNKRHCQGVSDCPGDGTCSGGCQDGWTLQSCTEACPSGTYGPGCSFICGNCTGDDICDHVTGNCPGDCKAGWQGTQCTQMVLAPSAQHNTITPYVIGGVIGAVLMLVVNGGIFMCLLRHRRLQCVTGAKREHPKQLTEMSDVSSAHTSSQGLSESQRSSTTHVYNNDYEVCESQSRSESKNYDVIQNEQSNYVNA